jgi:hypothetical protein
MIQRPLLRVYTLDVDTPELVPHPTGHPEIQAIVLETHHSMKGGALCKALRAAGFTKLHIKM